MTKVGKGVVAKCGGQVMGRIGCMIGRLEWK